MQCSIRSSGDEARSYTYDSWGRPLNAEGPGPTNPFQFAGREYDAETGLYYMRARYYDPAIGRFLSADPLNLGALLITAQDGWHGLALLPASPAAMAGRRDTGLLRFPQQLNLYSYASNQPTMFRDPSGLKCGVLVHMGWSLKDRAVESNGFSWTAEIKDFDAWITKNHYSLGYGGGDFVEIIDGQIGGTAGLVRLEDLPERYKFKYQSDEIPKFGSPEFWAELKKFAKGAYADVAADIKESYNKPWADMTWSEWWQNVLGK